MNLSVKHCSACGYNHRAMLVRDIPVEQWQFSGGFNHYVVCPRTGKRVVVQGLSDKSGAGSQDAPIPTPGENG